MLENVKAEEVVNKDVVEAVTPVVEQTVETVAKSGKSLKNSAILVVGVPVLLGTIGLSWGLYGLKKLYDKVKGNKDVEDEDGVVAEAEYNETSETENEEESDK